MASKTKLQILPLKTRRRICVKLKSTLSLAMLTIWTRPDIFVFETLEGFEKAWKLENIS
jgi:hypothetical protein